LRLKIQSITEGEYAIAKRDVDQLCAELGQPLLPNVQEMLKNRKWESVTVFSHTTFHRRADRSIVILSRFMHQQIANINPTVPKPNNNKRPHSAFNGTAPTGPIAVAEGAPTTAEPKRCKSDHTDRDRNLGVSNV
jgi:hypothetical protein